MDPIALKYKCSAEVSSHLPLTGVAFSPLSNFRPLLLSIRTNRESEVRKAAMEGSQQVDFNEVLKFYQKYQMSGHGQVSQI